jgi:hypothetical protein
MSDEPADDPQDQHDDGPNPDDPTGKRIRHQFRSKLGPEERSVVLAWASFAVTFGVTRTLTHWIRGGHGPKGGGMSLGGKHFHHYNLGIGLLTGVGALAIRGEDKHRHHPVTAVAYGTATALIADEAALLLDLEDVYWSKQGRTSVDIAIGIIAAGGLVVAGLPFWPAALKELRDR